MRTARVYYKDRLAGMLTEHDDGYTFAYDAGYRAQADARPVSLTMPLREEEYESRVLFPFFDGLVPEGWLLGVALRNTDASILDRMSLLLLCCRDCIGAVGVVPIEGKEMDDERG